MSAATSQPQTDSLHATDDACLTAVCDLPPFQHQPLDLSQQTIRVFRILAGAGPLQCELRHVTLDSRYTAVSYVCGPASTVNSVIVNGQSYLIRRNLHEFLLIMRQESRFYDYFWADSICINESDVPERNHQVANMGDIYTNASRVISWLCAHDEEAETFLRLAKRIIAKSTEDICANDPNPYRASIKALYAHEQLLPELFSHFCHMEYWCRTWIVQEMLLPSFLHTAQCGAISITLRELRSVMCAIHEAGDLPFKLQSSTQNWGAMPLLRLSRDRLHELHILDDSPAAFFSLFQRFEYTRCSDPRDHVYALGSLWKPRGSPLRADYDKSLGRLLWDVLMFCSRVGVGLLDFNALELFRINRRLLQEACSISGTFRNFDLGWGRYFSSKLHFTDRSYCTARCQYTDGSPNLDLIRFCRCCDCIPVAADPKATTRIREWCSRIGEMSVVQIEAESDYREHLVRQHWWGFGLSTLRSPGETHLMIPGLSTIQNTTSTGKVKRLRAQVDWGQPPLALLPSSISPPRLGLGTISFLQTVYLAINPEAMDRASIVKSIYDEQEQGATPSLNERGLLVPLYSWPASASYQPHRNSVQSSARSP